MGRHPKGPRRHAESPGSLARGREHNTLGCHKGGGDCHDRRRFVFGRDDALFPSENRLARNAVGAHSNFGAMKRTREEVASTIDGFINGTGRSGMGWVHLNPNRRSGAGRGPEKMRGDAGRVSAIHHEGVLQCSRASRSCASCSRACDPSRLDACRGHAVIAGVMTRSALAGRAVKEIRPGSTTPGYKVAPPRSARRISSDRCCRRRRWRRSGPGRLSRSAPRPAEERPRLRK